MCATHDFWIGGEFMSFWGFGIEILMFCRLGNLVKGKYLDAEVGIWSKAGIQME